ncbi:hypothetical protein [Sphingomonas colocasiae]|uniref:Uncharacterized protein n=1 Tax=Sphingomonas colocasiae TaxID=1848973 RepID=A0ABS7PYN9_9SPHN|nr:hypothetical protein [Sphingomonas colocasiae]MBY8825089.1 hypothetical protein [Sphingomonas colocasiae]
MKQLFAVALGFAICASPLHAQTIGGAARISGAGPVATGGFAGARIRIPFGGACGERRAIRAGLALAPMLRRDGQGQAASTLRIGEGLEFRFRGDVPVAHLSLAGQYLGPARYAPGGETPAGARRNLSGGGTTAAIVIGLAVLAGGGLLLALKDSGDPDNCTGGQCNNN